MSDFLELFYKNITSIIAIIVPIVALFKGWVRPQQTIFEQREKLSKHSYEVYKISNDECLKKLAIEYGYAAITKDNFLSLNQRKALVGSNDPVNDIDVFTKCRHLLDIKTDPLSFEWKLIKYKNKSYLNFSRICRAIFYGIGCFIFMLPITYEKIFPLASSKVAGLSNINKFWLVIYCFFVGGWVAWNNLSAGRKLTQAKKLIERHYITPEIEH